MERLHAFVDSEIAFFFIFLSVQAKSRLKSCGKYWDIVES